MLAWGRKPCWPLTSGFLEELGAGEEWSMLTDDDDDGSNAVALEWCDASFV